MSRAVRRITLPHDGWQPEAHQVAAWKAINDPDKYNKYLLAWHRRSGKDDIALHATAIKAAQRVGNYWHMLPKADQARLAMWEAINPHTGRRRWQDAFPEDFIKHVDNQSMKLTFHNNSSWQLLGSDNYDSLVGSSPVGIVMSEIGLANPAAYGYFSPILQENKGWFMGISSVRGRNHFHKMVIAGRHSKKTFVQVLSAKDTKVFDAEGLKDEYFNYINTFGEAIGKSMFRQEYLSDWNAATIGAVFSQELYDIVEQGRVRSFPYDPRFPVYTFWDLGVSDSTVILFWQIIGSQPVLIDWYEATDLGLEHYAKKLSERPYMYGGHFAPHDIVQREWGSGSSKIEQAKNFGIYFTVIPRTSKSTQIAAGSILLKRCIVNAEVITDGAENEVDTLFDGVYAKKIEDDCEYVLDALGEYKFRFDKDRKVMSKEPEHNWASHFADAFMQSGLILNNKSFGYGKMENREFRGLQGNANKNILKEKKFEPSISLSEALGKTKRGATRSAWDL